MIYNSFNTSKCWKYILWNNSASNDRRRMKQLPLEPAHRDESNGGGLILLQPLDTEIFNKSACGNVPFDVLSIISASSGHRRMRPLPFDSSRWAGSNGSCFISLGLLDAELFDKMLNGTVLQILKCWFLFIFHQISQHPVIIEEWGHHHSTRLNEPVLMVIVSFFYDCWMLRYFIKYIFNILIIFISNYLILLDNKFKSHDSNASNFSKKNLLVLEGLELKELEDSNSFQSFNAHY
jgi:hypothetical protein